MRTKDTKQERLIGGNLNNLITRCQKPNLFCKCFVGGGNWDQPGFMDSNKGSILFIFAIRMLTRPSILFRLSGTSFDLTLQSSNILARAFLTPVWCGEPSPNSEPTLSDFMLSVVFRYLRARLYTGEEEPLMGGL